MGLVDAARAEHLWSPCSPGAAPGGGSLRPPVPRSSPGRDLGLPEGHCPPRGWLLGRSPARRCSGRGGIAAASASEPPPGNWEKLPVMRQLSGKAESCPRSSGNPAVPWDEATASGDTSCRGTFPFSVQNQAQLFTSHIQAQSCLYISAHK